ncbi:patatin-like phospholipase family protein [Actinomycetes bacterium M1A6_2h]
MSSLGLVLAGGGVAGIAWELGFLQGLHDRSPAVAEALLASDVIVGTSAGSSVAAQITSGVTLNELVAQQLSTTSTEIDPAMDLTALVESFTAALSDPHASSTDRLRIIGTMAIAAPTVGSDVRRAVIASRLPSHEWPERDVRITAIDVSTGELVVFDRFSGVDLVDAVAASCAVPGVWPTVTIDGRSYMDGGVGSSTNCPVAQGCSAVVVLVPSASPGDFLFGGTVVEETAALDGAVVHSVFADEASVAAFGENPLDPATRAPSVAAGRSMGAREAQALGEFLGIAG